MNTSLTTTERSFMQRVWLAYVLLTLVSLAVVSVFYPLALNPLSNGYALGWSYLASLWLTAGRLPIGAQLGVSLARMALFGVAIGVLGQGRIFETAVVILGCLSYNLILFGVGVLRFVPKPFLGP
jgi:hypothetical protein